MMWELIIRTEASDRTYTVKHAYYLNFNDAQKAFVDTLNIPEINSAIVYTYINGYKPSIILAYNNDWNEDFISNPSWADC